MTQNQENINTKPNLSVAFTQKVFNELAGSVGEINVTSEHRRLVQGYYMGCDQALKTAESNRKKADQLPYEWNNVVLDSELAQNIVCYMRCGLDMNISNNLWAIPMWDSKFKKYRFSFRIGFEGRKLMAMRYALDKIIDIRTELVYKNDRFSVIKKGAMSGDSYEFEVPDPFNRGEIVGGFVFIEYLNPRLNKIVVMSKADIDKHKSKAQTAAIWNEWYDNMAKKTLIHYACKQITIDPQKIDDNYKKLLAAESNSQAIEAQSKIASMSGTGDFIDVAAASVTNADPVQSAQPAQIEANKRVETPVSMPVQNAAEPAEVTAEVPIQDMDSNQLNIPF